MSAVVTGQHAWQFDGHVSLVRRSESELEGWVSDELTGFGGLHGGYAAALALQALTTVAGDPAREPRSLHLQLPAVIGPGSVRLHPALYRRGASLSAASVRLEQAGLTVATGLASFGRGRPSLRTRSLRMPRVPTPLECPLVLEKPVPGATAASLVEHRAARGRPLGGAGARLLVWMRLREDRGIDAPLACMLADQTPPGLYGALSEPVAIPSVELSLYFADLAAAAESPWVLGDIRTIFAADGYAIEDLELWTPAGVLVLVMRHLRRVLGPVRISRTQTAVSESAGVQDVREGGQIGS